MTPSSATLRATDTPQRTIVFSSYYDATATTKEQDYGNFTAIVQEDFYFSSSLRAIALGRLRREASNNPYLAGLVEKYPEAVGYSLLRSRASDRAYNVTKEKWWKRLSKRITSGGDSLRVLETMVKIEMLLAGELFNVERLDGTVQVIPSEFCGSPTPSPVVPVPSGGREVNGIVYDAAGKILGCSVSGREVNGLLYDSANRIVAYRFGRLTPGGILTYGTSEIVEARFVIHIFSKKRVHQGRGLPWLLPSLRTARDLYEITRSKTKQIKDANSISGFIEKAGAADYFKGLEPPTLDDVTGEPAKERTSDPADPVKKTGPIVIELKPGTFIALEPGEKIHSLMSQYNATDYKELIMLMLHAMSTPVGLPVELWFSGLGDVNYSGYKGLGVQWNGRRQDVIEFLISSFYEPLYAWRVGKAVNEDELPANPDGDEEAIEWVFRRTPILDDEKEGKSNAIKLQSGETDHAAIWEEQGFSPEEIFGRRRQTWIKLQIAAGELAEDTDPATVKAPIGFLLRSELPGEVTYPRLPDGSGSAEEQDPAAAEAADAANASADKAGESATQANEAATDARAALRAIQQLLAGLQRAA